MRVESMVIRKYYSFSTNRKLLNPEVHLLTKAITSSLENYVNVQIILGFSYVHKCQSKQPLIAFQIVVSETVLLKKEIGCRQ